MKITVVTDAAGRIVGFSHDAPGSGGTATHATALAADEGQAMHSVEVPADLLSRLGDDAFATELFRHVVVTRGRTASLAKPAAKSKATTKRR